MPFIRVHAAGRLALFVALVVVASTPVRGQERTSAIIEELVGQIAAGMATFDQKLSEWGTQADRLEQAVERAHGNWNAATDNVEREELEARYLMALAELNMWDRQQVEVAVDTLDGILPDLVELKGWIIQLDAERQQVPTGSSRTASVRHFVTNTAIVIDRLRRNLKDQVLIGTLGAIENQLVTQDELYADELGPDQSLGTLDEAFHRLENVYVTLVQVRGVLDAERVQYASGAIIGVVDSTAAGIEALVDSSQVHELGAAMRERVADRLRRYEATQDEGRAARDRGSQPSPADQERLRRIRQRHRP